MIDDLLSLPPIMLVVVSIGAVVLAVAGLMDGRGFFRRVALTQAVMVGIGMALIWYFR